MAGFRDELDGFVAYRWRDILDGQQAAEKGDKAGGMGDSKTAQEWYRLADRRFKRGASALVGMRDTLRIVSKTVFSEDVQGAIDEIGFLLAIAEVMEYPEE